VCLFIYLFFLCFNVDVLPYWCNNKFTTLSQICCRITKDYNNWPMFGLGCLLKLRTKIASGLFVSLTITMNEQ